MKRVINKGRERLAKGRARAQGSSEKRTKTWAWIVQRTSTGYGLDSTHLR